MDASERDFEDLGQFFKALGHPARLQILMHTLEGEFCVQEIGEKLDRSQPNVSQHLTVLRERGLVIPERRGKRVCYRLADERIGQIIMRAMQLLDDDGSDRVTLASGAESGGIPMELTVAFSTDDGETLKTDDHAGMAKFFDVYRYTNGQVEFVERRENSKYDGDESMRHGDPKKAKKSLDALVDVDVWASPRFGPNLPRLLKKLTAVVVRVDTLEEGVDLVGQHLDEIREQVQGGEDRSHVVLKPE